MLIDLKLPDISGIEVLKRIKENSPGTEVIILTAYVSLDTVMEAINIGAFSYLQKPYDTERLLLDIHRALERKHAEDMLKIYQFMVESAHDTIFYKDPESRYIIANPKTLKTFGLPYEEVIGRDDTELLPPEEAQKNISDDHKVFRTGKSTEICKHMTGADRKGYHFHAIKVPHFDSNGNVIGLVGVARDITELKRAEEALKKLNKELEKRVEERTTQLQIANKELTDANKKLQELNQMKNMFLASMSHELRTPLNSIIGFTGIVLQGMAGELNEEQHKQLSMAYSSAKHLLSLINDLLDINRIEAGRIELDPKEFSLEDAVREVADNFSVTLAEKGLSLAIDVPAVTLYQDDRRFKQVVMNSLSNAVKFTDEGSIKIKGRVVGENIELSVADTGIGIKEEDMANLFLPFSQVDMTTSRKHAGVGLGLYLSKKLVGLMGGKMWAVSECGKGSVFTFTVPIEYASGD